MTVLSAAHPALQPLFMVIIVYSSHCLASGKGCWPVALPPALDVLSEGREACRPAFEKLAGGLVGPPGALEALRKVAAAVKEPS
jgi:hypothetical protein